MIVAVGDGDLTVRGTGTERTDRGKIGLETIGHGAINLRGEVGDRASVVVLLRAGASAARSGKRCRRCRRWT